MFFVVGIILKLHVKNLFGQRLNFGQIGRRFFRQLHGKGHVGRQIGGEPFADPPPAAVKKRDDRHHLNHNQRNEDQKHRTKEQRARQHLDLQIAHRVFHFFRKCQMHFSAPSSYQKSYSVSSI